MALEATQGVKRILLYRVLGEFDDATKIALQTSHELTSSLDIETEATKDFVVSTDGQIEQEISSSFILATGDDSLDTLKEAHEQKGIVELWDVDITEENKQDDKYKATYFQAKITDISESADVEGAVEVDIDFTVVGGIGQRGYTSVTDEQEEVIQYVFEEAVEDGI